MKGQAFDVFRLLIAGIVAMAILSILLPMLSAAFNPSQSPDSAAQDVVNAAYSSPGQPKTSSKVVFNKDSVITKRGVVKKAQGLYEERVCFVRCDEDPVAQYIRSCPSSFIDRFEIEDDFIRLAEHVSRQDAKIKALCVEGACTGSEEVECAITVVPP